MDTPVYGWLNPPAGTFTVEEYLRMHKHWMDSISASRNKLSCSPDPLKQRFFGNRAVKVNGDTVTLEEI